MTKRFCLAVLIVAVLWLPVLGADELTVLSPNTNAYSATELLSLQTAMKNLQDLLGDYGLGSGRYFASTEWMNPDFAAYTEGVLASNGYQTHLIAQEGWPRWRTRLGLGQDCTSHAYGLDSRGGIARNGKSSAHPWDYTRVC